MGELKEALGRGTGVPFGGQTLLVEPLDFNDLCDLEEYAGVNADDIEIAAHLESARNRRHFLWLILRKADPDLSDEDRAAGRYRMTEAEAGRMIKFGTTVDQWTLINTALGVSGLVSKPEDADDPKPEPDAVPAKEAAPKTTRKRASAPSA